MHIDHASAVKKKKGDHEKFVGGFTLSGLLGSGRASMLPLGTLSLGLWIIAVDQAFIAGTRASRTVGSELISPTISLLSWQWLSFWSSLSTRGTIFSSSRIIVCTVPTQTWNCALIVSIDTRRSLSMKSFIWPINSGVLTSLLLPHHSSSLTDSLPSLNLLCSIHARCSKSSLKHYIRFCGIIFSKFKTEFYCISFF